MLEESTFFDEINEAKFLNFPRRDRFRTWLRRLDQVWTLPLSYLALRKAGVTSLDLQAISDGMARVNERLRKQRAEVKSSKILRFLDLNIELNEIGIEMTNASMKERQLLKQCVDLRRQTIADRNLDNGRAFVKSAEQLFSAREDSIAVMRKKNQKQQEVAKELDEFRLLTEDDVRDLNKSAVVDFFTSLGVGKLTGYATAYELGGVFAKYAHRAAEKTAMSTKSLNEGIWIRQRCQDRYRAWLEKPAVREMVASSKAPQSGSKIP